MKIKIENVLLNRHEQLSSYVILFELMNTENLYLLKKNLNKVADGRKLTLIIEDEPIVVRGHHHNIEEIQIISWVNDFCYTCRELIKSTDETHNGHHRMSDDV